MPNGLHLNPINNLGPPGAQALPLPVNRVLRHANKQALIAGGAKIAENEFNVFKLALVGPRQLANVTLSILAAPNATVAAQRLAKFVGLVLVSEGLFQCYPVSSLSIVVGINAFVCDEFSLTEQDWKSPIGQYILSQPIICVGLGLYKNVALELLGQSNMCPNIDPEFATHLEEVTEEIIETVNKTSNSAFICYNRRNIKNYTRNYSKILSNPKFINGLVFLKIAGKVYQYWLIVNFGKKFIKFIKKKSSRKLFFKYCRKVKNYLIRKIKFKKQKLNLVKVVLVT